jgi:pilus assembly protein CpaD
MRCEEKAMKPFGPSRRAARNRWRAGTAAAVVLAGAALAACQTAGPGPVAVATPAVATPVVAAPVVPTRVAVEAPGDYRLRHPIKFREGTRAVELFIGSHRTDLTPVQRAQVAYFAHGWHRNATGGVAIRVPTGTPNEEAARRSVREIQSILVASGIPADGIVVTDLPPFSPDQLVPVVLEYPKINANAGPCGRWPEDLGPASGLDYMTNAQYWNFGCSLQHNVAVMTEEPVDLLQPRAEIPPYTARRDVVFEKYKKGESTATVYPDLNKAKISDVGQ